MQPSFLYILDFFHRINIYFYIKINKSIYSILYFERSEKPIGFTIMLIYFLVSKFLGKRNWEELYHKERF